MEMAVRYLSIFIGLLALLLAVGNEAAVAQTTTPSIKRALRQHDRDQCIKEAADQKIARRDRATFILKCMGARQDARRKNVGAKNAR